MDKGVWWEGEEIHVNDIKERKEREWSSNKPPKRPKSLAMSEP
jgi:hypothetical protein